MGYLIENTRGCLKLARRRIEPSPFREIYFSKGKAIRRDSLGSGVEVGPTSIALGGSTTLNPLSTAFGRVFILDISGTNVSTPYIWRVLVGQSGTGATFEFVMQGSTGSPAMDHLISMYFSHSTTLITITLLEAGVGATAQIKAWYGAGEFISPLSFLEQEVK